MSTLLVTGTTWIRYTNKKAHAAISQISRLENVVTAVESREAHDAKAGLERAELNLKQANQEYDLAERTVVRATDALASHSAATRLMEFVKQREGKGGYGDYLGLIATIRKDFQYLSCLLYTSPSPRDRTRSRMPSSA